MASFTAPWITRPLKSETVLWQDFAVISLSLLTHPSIRIDAAPSRASQLAYSFNRSSLYGVRQRRSPLSSS
jgi:hypothetical protein